MTGREWSSGGTRGGRKRHTQASAQAGICADGDTRVHPPIAFILPCATNPIFLPTHGTLISNVLRTRMCALPHQLAAMHTHPHQRTHTASHGQPACTHDDYSYRANWLVGACSWSKEERLGVCPSMHMKHTAEESVGSLVTFGKLHFILDHDKHMQMHTYSSARTHKHTQTHPLLHPCLPLYPPPYLPACLPACTHKHTHHTHLLTYCVWQSSTARRPARCIFMSVLASVPL